MAIVAIAKKDLRLLLRDTRALIILLAMPIFFILVLGVSLGEGFGQKPNEGLRVSVLVLDEGVPRFFDRHAMVREGVGHFASLPGVNAGAMTPLLGQGLVQANHPHWFPHASWSELVLRDLGETGGIKIELLHSRAEAEELVRSGKRAGVLVLGPLFSKRVARCSFLAGGWREMAIPVASFPHAGDPVALALAGLVQETQNALPLYLFEGLNPFFRDGVNLTVLDVEVIRDPTQQTAAAILDQVAQGSLLRVIMPWMIGRAFEKLADPSFLAVLGQEEQLPAPIRLFLSNPFVPLAQKKALSSGLQNALQNIFPRYNLTAKTWAALTKEHERLFAGENREDYQADGIGWLRRGAKRYQFLVPAYLVMFAFFLVLTGGWLFVAERRLGTMKRLRIAPISRLSILLGKMLPCLAVSLFQGFFILAAGKFLFDMKLGPEPLWLIPVVFCTSLAAMSLSLLIATLARTETQVAIYGTLIVLVLAGLSGCFMGDRSLMPEAMQVISQATPHAWALDAYRQLLLVENRPNLEVVIRSCAVLLAFSAGFLTCAWWTFRTDA